MTAVAPSTPSLVGGASVPLPVATPVQHASDDFSSTSSRGDTEAEHSITGLLRHAEQFAPIVPMVFSFLSVIELMYIEQVNHVWAAHVANARSVHIHKLHLGQFWSRLGAIDISYFTRLCSQFTSIDDLNVSYCHFLTGDALMALVTSIPSYQSIEKLNLFYCYQLTDENILAVIPLLPNLTDLNIGRCIRISDKTVRALSTQMKHLKALTLSSLPLLTEETLMLFDDTSLFPSLTYLNLVNAGKFSVVEIDEVRNSRPGVKIVGPEELHRIPDKNGKKQHTRKDINAET